MEELPFGLKSTGLKCCWCMFDEFTEVFPGWLECIGIGRFWLENEFRSICYLYSCYASVRDCGFFTGVWLLRVNAFISVSERSLKLAMHSSSKSFCSFLSSSASPVPPAMRFALWLFMLRGSFEDPFASAAIDVIGIWGLSLLETTSFWISWNNYCLLFITPFIFLFYANWPPMALFEFIAFYYGSWAFARAANPDGDASLIYD